MIGKTAPMTYMTSSSCCCLLGSTANFNREIKEGHLCFQWAQGMASISGSRLRGSSQLHRGKGRHARRVMTGCVGGRQVSTKCRFKGLIDGEMRGRMIQKGQQELDGAAGRRRSLIWRQLTGLPAPR